MIKSMTAFAREERRDDLGELVWEIRSVNHRFLETFVRLPEELRALEPMVREKAGKKLARGKLDCTLRYKASGVAPASISVNTRLAGQLLDAANEIGRLMEEGVPPTAMEIMRWPGVLETESVDLGEVQKAALVLLDSTFENLVESREREGEKLGELIRLRVADMREQVKVARQRMPEVVEAVRSRLQTRLSELEELDESRIEQEMVMLAQKMDVDEEMDRLTTHLDEVESVLGHKKPIGRRLDFLMQELNREANTLGSKSADTTITSVSVEMKVLIEQMREQIQNIE